MAFRLVPEVDITQNVRRAGAEQIDRVLTKLSGKKKDANAVHETRKAMKRLRALLHLIKPAMRKGEFQRDETRIKQIAKYMSGVRDLQAMLETVARLEAYDQPVGQGPVAAALRAHLEEKRDAAEKSLHGSGGTQARKLLREARKAFAEIMLVKDDFNVLASTIENDYSKARRAFRRAYEVNQDDAFHDWRKYVQRHWRQMLLITPSWPKALRPHIAAVSSLSEILGEDHDLFVLSHFIENENADFGRRKEIKAYLSLCRRRQIELRAVAHDLGMRLFSEKPASLAARLKAYWATAPRLEIPEPPEENDDSTNVVILKR